MIGVGIAPRTRKCRGQRLNAPGTSRLFLFYGVPYGLAALIRACALATALLAKPGGGVQVLLPVACTVMTLEKVYGTTADAVLRQ